MAEDSIGETEEYEDLAKSEKRTSSLHIEDDLHGLHSRFTDPATGRSPELETSHKKVPIREKTVASKKTGNAPNEKLVRLLNAIKNRRRLKILQILSKHPHDLEELRVDLKDEGCYHSLNTVENYIEALIETSLVRAAKNGYTLTSLGIEIQDTLSRHELEAFSPHSNCYEELCIQALRSGRKTYQELILILEPSTLQRVLKRLEKAELIVRDHSSDRVFFSTVSGKPDGRLSPIEARILKAIKRNRGLRVPARELSKLVGINLRRTYKYLSRLKQKKRIAQWRKPVTYELTEKGESIARCLEEIANSRPEFSEGSPVEFGFQAYSEIKNDAFMAIRLSGETGVLQSELWKKLGLDGREGSRQVRRLEKKGFIKRRGELRAGKWTYRIFPVHKFSSVDSIINIPCSGCDEDLSGKCPNGTSTPETCRRLTRWLIDSNSGDPVS
jgi:DNA-binding MarR family transcriptional regulator